MQLGTAYNADGTQLLRIGGPPLLLEPVQATLTFKGGPVTSARVVDIHGVPGATDVLRTGNQVTIDGRYESYYYEIRRAAGRCLARTQASALAPVTPAKDALFLTAPRPDGLTLDPAAPFAEVPYVCSFASGGLDPEAVLGPGGNPLIFYQVTGALAGPIQAVKDRTADSVRFTFP
jgi:hypothetical protein